MASQEGAIWPSHGNDGSAGDSGTQFGRLYQELRALAGRHLRREHAGHTLQPTALAHEAYLRLFEQKESAIQGRTHFLSVASVMIRRILVDHARKRKAIKRGGNIERARLDYVSLAEFGSEPIDVLDLDAALVELARLNPRQSRMVELRFFSGLSIEETARALDVSEGTVKNDWRIARAWLRVRLGR